MSAARQALAAYRDLPRATRLHTRLRWWWCPFPAIEAAVPCEGDVLEVGCGHGLLSLYLATAAPGRRVHGVDIDDAKIAHAAIAAEAVRPSATVTFAPVGPGYLPDGAWDAIVIADVLYLLAPEVQRAIVVAAAASLRPGGAVVLKEMGLTPRWKLRWNRAQETLATRVLRITDHTGAGLHFVAPDVMAGWLAEAGLDTSVTPVDRGYPWPHQLVVGRRSGA
ncbi:MAG: class I SAM-dependent methyltransferase [Acidimicrobiales bacterium]